MLLSEKIRSSVESAQQGLAHNKNPINGSYLNHPKCFYQIYLYYYYCLLSKLSLEIDHLGFRTIL